MSNVSQDRDGNLTVKEGLNEIKDNFGNVYQISDTGIDDSGKALKIAQRPPQWISPTKLRYPNGKVVSFDPNEKCFEVYNNSFKTVFFENIHYNPEERRQTPQLITIPPDHFGFIPHSYYIFWYGFVGNTEPVKVNLIVNHGDLMFKGNKLVSRPENQKKFY